jgi:hypothetical protein
MRLAQAVVIGAIASIAVACGGAVGIPTIPPIPSLPSIPPIDLPSGLPTIPPGVIPSASGTCPYVTVEEVNAAFGSTATLTNSDGDCTFTFSNFSTVVVSIEEGSDLSTSKMLLGDTAKDLNVGGFPAVSGVFIGQPLVHVQKGANQMQVLGVLTGSDDATIAKLVQIATIAVGRWPG